MDNWYLFAPCDETWYVGDLEGFGGHYWQVIKSKIKDLLVFSKQQVCISWLGSWEGKIALGICQYLDGLVCW